jgi:hypothetical protein
MNLNKTSVAIIAQELHESTINLDCWGYSVDATTDTENGSFARLTMSGPEFHLEIHFEGLENAIVNSLEKEVWVLDTDKVGGLWMRMTESGSIQFYAKPDTNAAFYIVKPKRIEVSLNTFEFNKTKKWVLE